MVSVRGQSAKRRRSFPEGDEPERHSVRFVSFELRACVARMELCAMRGCMPLPFMHPCGSGYEGAGFCLSFSVGLLDAVTRFFCF